MDLLVFNMPLLLFYPDEIWRFLSIQTMPTQRDRQAQMSSNVLREIYIHRQATIKTCPMVDVNSMANLLCIYLKKM